MSFTGYPATDLLILKNLSDQDLGSVCATNTYLSEICNNESFWLGRTVDKFGDMVAPKASNKYDVMRGYLPTGTTWKEYYKWLVHMTITHPMEGFLIVLRSFRMDVIRILGKRFVDKVFELYPNGEIPNDLTNKPFYVKKDIQDFIADVIVLNRQMPGEEELHPLGQSIIGEFGITNMTLLSMLMHIYIMGVGLTPEIKGFTDLSEMINGMIYMHESAGLSIPDSELTDEQIERLLDPNIINRLNSETRSIGQQMTRDA